MSATVDLIARFEGFQSEPYWDHQQWSIGYGSYAGSTDQNSRPNITVTRAEARQMLQQQLPRYERAVDKYDGTYNWTPNERAALVSFAYNIGSIDQLTAGGTRSKAEIQRKMLEYNKASGRVINGLTQRRRAEAAMFGGGTLPSDIPPEGFTPPADEQFAGASGEGQIGGDGGITSTSGATSLTDIVTRKENAGEWWPNELDEEFESYTYNLELFIVDEETSTTFLKNETILLDDIMNDAWPSDATKRVTIAMTGATTEFNIQNLSVQALGRSSGQASRMGGTATNLQFDIMQVGNTSLADNLQNAALLMGYTSLTTANYFLKIKFVGYSEGGAQSTAIPATKVFPFKIKNVGDVPTSTDQRGTITTIDGVITPDHAFTQHINTCDNKFEFVIQPTLKETIESFLENLKAEIEKHNYSGHERFVNTYYVTADADFETKFFQSPMNGPDANLSAGGGIVARTESINIAEQKGIVASGMSLYEVLQDICVQSVEVRNAITQESETFNDVVMITPNVIAKPKGFNVLTGEHGYDVTYHLSIERQYIVQNPIDQSTKAKAVSNMIQEIFDSGRCNKIYYYHYTGMNDQVLDAQFSFNRQLIKSYVTPADEYMWNNFVQGNSDKLNNINDKAQTRIDELRGANEDLTQDVQDASNNLTSLRNQLEARADEAVPQILEQANAAGFDLRDEMFDGMNSEQILASLLTNEEIAEIAAPFISGFQSTQTAIQELAQQVQNSGSLSSENEREIQDIMIEAIGANLSDAQAEALSQITENFNSVTSSIVPASRNFVMIEELSDELITRLTSEQFDALLDALMQNPVVFKRVAIPMLLESNRTRPFRSTDPEGVELARQKYYESLDNDVSMQQLDITIKGDPYWLQNYITPRKAKELFGDRNADERYKHHVMSHNGNNYIIIVTNKAAGVDDNDNIKIANLATMCYMVKNITNSFQSGVFTQTLHMVKMPFPDSFKPNGIEDSSVDPDAGDPRNETPNATRTPTDEPTVNPEIRDPVEVPQFTLNAEDRNSPEYQEIYQQEYDKLAAKSKANNPDWTEEVNGQTNLFKSRVTRRAEKAYRAQVALGNITRPTTSE